MEFVTFEIAKKLKEKGFKELCLAFYTNDDILYYNAGTSYRDCYLSHNFMPKDSVSGKFVDAPTISQVLTWLRKEKEIDIVIYPIDGNTVFMGGEKYILSVYIHKKRDYKLHHDNIDKYIEWEQAALAGIEYTLDNLI